MAHENADPFVVPPPILPTEEDLRKALKTVAPMRYRQQYEHFYVLAGKLTENTRRGVLDVLLSECDMHRTASGRQQKPLTRAAPEPRIAKAKREKAYRNECDKLERLLRQIEEHPLVATFCRAHMVRYPFDEAFCPAHDHWKVYCPVCHDFDTPRIGRPRVAQRRRLLNAIVPKLKADGRTTEASIALVAAACRCLGDPVAPRTLQRQWFRLLDEGKAHEQAVEESKRGLPCS